jgi:hypothetical protein
MTKHSLPKLFSHVTPKRTINGIFRMNNEAFRPFSNKIGDIEREIVISPSIFFNKRFSKFGNWGTQHGAECACMKCSRLKMLSYDDRPWVNCILSIECQIDEWVKWEANLDLELALKILRFKMFGDDCKFAREGNFFKKYQISKKNKFYFFVNFQP